MSQSILKLLSTTRTEPGRAFYNLQLLQVNTILKQQVKS